MLSNHRQVVHKIYRLLWSATVVRKCQPIQKAIETYWMNQLQRVTNIQQKLGFVSMSWREHATNKLHLPCWYQKKNCSVMLILTSILDVCPIQHQYLSLTSWFAEMFDLHERTKWCWAEEQKPRCPWIYNNIYPCVEAWCSFWIILPPVCRSCSRFFLLSWVFSFSLLWKINTGFYVFVLMVEK